MVDFALATLWRQQVVDDKKTLTEDLENKSARSWWGWILATYWIALFIATHLPPRVPILPGAASDKAAHLGAYALLALLMACYWQTSAGWLVREHFLWIIIACSAFGVVDELLQIPVGRFASVADWVADSSGAVLGVVSFAVVRQLRQSWHDRQ